MEFKKAILENGGHITGDITVEEADYPNIGAKNTVSGRKIVLEARSDGAASLASFTNEVWDGYYIINALPDGNVEYRGGTFTTPINAPIEHFDGADILAEAVKLSRTAAVRWIRIINGINSPYEPERNNDFVYCIINEVDAPNDGIHWRRIIAYDVRSNSMYERVALDSVWQNWVKIHTQQGDTIVDGNLLAMNRVYVNNATRTSKNFGLGIDNQAGAHPGLMFEDKWLIQFDPNTGAGYSLADNSSGWYLRNIDVVQPDWTGVLTNRILMVRK